MLRLIPILILLFASILAANIRLYLTDGEYQIVREYEIRGDRVRYYSTERGDWEEIPLALVDMKRTQAEQREREEEISEQAKAISEEEQFERAQREEAERVPVQVGVYLAGTQLTALKQAESKINSSKGRSILKVLSPLPVVAGKSTIEIEGERSVNVVTSDRPEFYFRLSAAERFAIFRLSPKKGARVVQTWNTMPVTNEIVEEQQDLAILHRQLDDGLYKIWPAEPLKPGEYAVVEYTQGKGNIQIWDFSYRP